MEILAERLKNLRTQRNLSQAELAKELGLSSRQYQRYEYDKSEPTAPIILSLADFFQVSTDYLLGRTDNPEVNGRG